MKISVQFVRCFSSIAVMAALASTTGCGKKSPPDVLARVGEQTITLADFEAEIKRRTGNRQVLPNREKLLEEMIARAALVQRAKATGLEKADDVKRTVEDVLIAKLQEAELKPKIAAAQVTPEEVRAAYEKDLPKLTQPEKAHLAIVYLAAKSKTGPNPTDEIIARAEEARRLAVALPATVPGFGTVSAEFSDDQVSRYRGGDAGWHTADELEDRWPRAVIEAGLALKSKGEVSDIIRQQDGFYLVKKMDVRPEAVPSFEQAQAGIERRLLTARRSRIEEEFRQTLLLAAKVQTDLQKLSGVEYPTQSIASTPLPPSLPRSP